MFKILAATSSDEVFKSMGESMNSEINPLHIASVIVGLIAIVVLLTLFSRRQSQPAQPKVLNHDGKLMRELAKAIGLKRREIKRLKQLADREGVEYAMTLLLCPSVLKRSLQKNPATKIEAESLVPSLIES